MTAVEALAVTSKKLTDIARACGFYNTGKDGKGGQDAEVKQMLEDSQRLQQLEDVR